MPELLRCSPISRESQFLLKIRKRTFKKFSALLADFDPAAPEPNLPTNICYTTIMKNQILTFRTIIKKDGRFYHGSVPTLPGCHTQGKTIEETRKNLRQAITGCLETLQKHNQAFPDDTGIESVETFDLRKICYA